MEEKNRLVLQAAARILFESGFDAATMEAVAAEAKVSKGTLYARYPTKEALLHAVVESRVEAWSEAGKSRDHLLTDDLQQRLRHHAETIILSLGTSEIRALDRLINGSATPFPQLARAMHDIGHKFTVQLLANEIRSGTADDPHPAKDPERVANQLLSMLLGWYRTEETIRTIPDDEARSFANSAIDLLFAGRAAW